VNGPVLGVGNVGNGVKDTAAPNVEPFRRRYVTSPLANGPVKNVVGSLLFGRA